MPVGEANGDHHRLLEVQVFLPLEGAFHVLLIFPPVGLCAQRVHRRALSEVQHPVLDAAAVCRLGHLAAQRIELANQVPLSRAADGGIAGHIADRVEVDREDDSRKAHPRAR